MMGHLPRLPPPPLPIITVPHDKRPGIVTCIASMRATIGVRGALLRSHPTNAPCMPQAPRRLTEAAAPQGVHTP